MHPRRALIILLAACCCAIGFALSTPLPTEAGISPNEAKAWHPDLAAAARFAESRSTDVSFAIYDMRDRLSAHEGERDYIMASTFKVMLLVAYLRQAAGRDLTQNERDLLVPMIRESDNASATRVRDILGPGPIYRLADDADMAGFAWSESWGLCRATPRDGARLMRRLRGLLPSRHRGFALRQLESVIPRQRWGVAHVEPKGWDLAFKGGWGLRAYRVEHQVALLRHGKRRIGVSVLTQGNPSRRYGRATLEGVYERLLKDLPR
ncbi:MAG: class A beta-lactamase-related serine hydrolase [Actinomycetota bacterium]|nr:class A beta-lactamase-related serine hydrolase [Actinomycetota bacterium]